VPDAALLLALHHALTDRATTPEQRATVDRDGDAILRFLAWLDTVPPATAGAVTIYVGPGGAVHLYGLDEPDRAD
jgi:hypothetical protein